MITLKENYGYLNGKNVLNTLTKEKYFLNNSQKQAYTIAVFFLKIDIWLSITTLSKINEFIVT